MVSYEVTATVRPDLKSRYAAYMRTHHIADVLATGCFTGAEFGALEGGRYRARYLAPDAAALDRYLAEHAGRLRAAFGGHFPDGIALERAVWHTVETWTR
jgi:hypothetical protein